MICHFVVSTYSVVVVCPFINEASLTHAKETKHMHWLALQPHVEKHPNTLFVLILLAKLFIQCSSNTKHYYMAGASIQDEY